MAWSRYVRHAVRDAFQIPGNASRAFCFTIGTSAAYRCFRECNIGTIRCRLVVTCPVAVPASSFSVEQIQRACYVACHRKSLVPILTEIVAADIQQSV